MTSLETSFVNLEITSQSVRSASTGDLIDRDTRIACLEQYVATKLQKNDAGGRPHFIAELAKNGRDPKEELLNIFEAVWIKNRSIASVAHQYKTGYKTIARILQDCEPFKNDIIIFLQQTPRRKRFFNRELETSDFETVQNYIKRATRDGLKRWKDTVIYAENCWRFLNYHDPADWTAEDVLSYFKTLTVGAQAHMVDCLRQVAPQLREKGGEHELKGGRFRAQLMRRKKDIFNEEINLIIEALKAKNIGFELLIFLLHTALGAREGSHGVDRRSGMTGLTWDRFHGNFTLCDDYESKVHGGIWWRDCPLDLLFRNLPHDLWALWIERGKPTSEYIIKGGYTELLAIYKRINQAVAEYYTGKLDPALYKELTTLHPHDADKIHVNLLWEAEVPLEVVAGEYIGGNEGVGSVGRGWLSTDVIKKYYLSLNRRSDRYKKIYAKIIEYSAHFNVNAQVTAVVPAAPIARELIPLKVALPTMS